MTSTNRGETDESGFHAAQAMWEARLASNNAMEDRDPTAGDLFHWPMPLGLSLRWVLLGSDPAGRAAFCLIDDAGPVRSRDVRLTSSLADARPNGDEGAATPSDLLLRPDFTLEIPLSAVTREDRVGDLDPSAWSTVQQVLADQGFDSFKDVESGQDAEAQDYLAQLGQTRALIESYLNTGIYRLPTSSFVQDRTPAEAQRPALAAAGAQSLLESLRRELREDAFLHLDLEAVFPGRLEILAIESGLTLLHDAGQEQAEPPRAELAEGEQRRELEWQRDETLRWSRLSEVLPWSNSGLHLILTLPDGRALEFEIHDDRS